MNGMGKGASDQAYPIHVDHTGSFSQVREFCTKNRPWFVLGTKLGFHQFLINALVRTFDLTHETVLHINPHFTFSATSCQDIPYPPLETQLVFSHDPASSISLDSEYSLWNPKVPFRLKIPPDFCEKNKNKLLVAGVVTGEKPTISFLDNLKENSTI